MPPRGKLLRRVSLAAALILFSVGICLHAFFHVSTPSEPPLAGELVGGTLAVDGMQRTYTCYLPPHPASRPAVVFVLHGSKGTGRAVRALTACGFDRLADRDGFLVVYPDGYKRHWNDCRVNASYAANTEDVDDPAFFRALIEHFVREHHADPARVFVTGYSNGGHMAWRLAWEMPEAIAAVAPVAAGLPEEENSDCASRGIPVSVALFSGTDDPLNPYEGGTVNLLGDTSRGAVRSARESVAYWARLAGLSAAPETVPFPETDGDPATRVTLYRWQGLGQHEVRLYTLHGSGHVIPSPAVHYGRFFGGDAGDLDAADEIWNFFKEVSGK